MTTYPHTRASILASAKSGSSPKDQYITLFQKTLDEQFYNSSDWWTIKEETSLGSQVYADTDVRINHVINAETGLKLGDDWKTVLFKNITHPIQLGKHYIFDDSTWLTINTELVKNLTGTCTIRRCNNTLRWIDEPTGAYYEEPCCIEYMVKEARDYATQGSPFITPGGFLKIFTQLNERTGKINENQRFLFGNTGHWTCYKVIGTGLNDFKNDKTYDNDSATVLVIDLIANFVNDELDDIINGIADVVTNAYSISLNTYILSGSPATSGNLFASVLYNGDSASRPIEWTSSDSSIAGFSGSSGSSILLDTIVTGSSSGSAIVIFKANGSCVITASIYNNAVSASAVITVSASPVINSDIRVTPDRNYVLEGQTQIFSTYLYENDIAQSDTFTYTCTSGSIPTTSYVFTSIDGNNFSIKNNLRDVSSNLTITCLTSGSVQRDLEIYLRGAWLYDNA